MKKYKRTSTALLVLAVFLSHMMVGVVAWQYRGYLCGIQHAGYSAPRRHNTLRCIT